MTDGDLLARMHNFEDNFVERKTTSDLKDFLKTIVAFANSTPSDGYSVLFIGVRDSGEIQTPQPDLDKIQRRLNREIEKAYPKISCTKKIVVENGRQALAVIVPYSPNRPHFAGPAYVRIGSESVNASDEQFNELISSRDSKVGRILAHKGKPVFVQNVHHTPHGNNYSYWSSNPFIYDCNRDFIVIATGPEPKDRQTFPMSQIELGFNYERNCLAINIAR